MIDLAHDARFADLIEAAKLIERNRFTIGQNQAMEQYGESALIEAADFTRFA